MTLFSSRLEWSLLAYPVLNSLNQQHIINTVLRDAKERTIAKSNELKLVQVQDSICLCLVNTPVSVTLPIYQTPDFMQ